MKKPLPFWSGVCSCWWYHASPPVREGGGTAVFGGRPGLEHELLTVAGQRRTSLSGHRLRL